MATTRMASTPIDSSGSKGQLVSIANPASSGVTRIGNKTKAPRMSLFQMVGSVGIIVGLLSMAVLGVSLASQRGKKKTVEVVQATMTLDGLLHDSASPISSHVEHPIADPLASPKIPTPPHEIQTPTPPKDTTPPVPVIEPRVSVPVQVNPEVVSPPKIVKKEEVTPPRPRVEIEETPAPPKTAPTPPAVIAKSGRKEGGAKLTPTEKKPAKDPNIEQFGTPIEFQKTLQDAYNKGAKEKKPVMILHFHGTFEQNAFTSEEAELLRSNALMDESVAEFISEHFVAAYIKSPVPKAVKGKQPPDIVTTYFCLAATAGVIHAIPGPVNAPEFLKEAKWIWEKREACKSKRVGMPTNMRPSCTPPTENASWQSMKIPGS